ncbi:MAG: glycosyltransferase family 4 protein [Candidatus Rokuibacteriota bacterium]
MRVGHRGVDGGWRPLRIAQVAPLYEAVPPPRYGGTERIVSYLTEELTRRGHDVTLYASADSETRARLVPCAPKALRLDPPRDPILPHVLELEAAYGAAATFDVMHAHTDYLTLPFARGAATPTVLTLHGRLDLPGFPEVLLRYADVPLVSISDSQRAPFGEDVRWAATVHHGIPTADYRFVERPGAYLAFVGRVSPEKGLDLAIRVARAAGVPLRIAAKVDAVDREFFDTEIRPLLAGPLVEFIGEVDEATKVELLSGALALLFPVDWPEPFGLVMLESLACGTPVIARPCGSVPEVVVDGVTGFLGRSMDELVAAAGRAHRLDRRTCRAHVEARFSVARMADAYEAVYRAVIEGARRRPSAA